MRRRTLLRRAGALGALGAVGLAGCQGPANSPGAGDGGTPNSQPSPTPPWEDPVTDVTLQTTGSECASGDQSDAEITFHEGETAIRVHGSLTAPTPCHQVRLVSVDYDDGVDELSVALGTEQGDQGGCVQCVGRVTFEATVELAESLPETVVVDGPEGKLARVERPGGTDAPAGDVSIADTTFEVLDQSGTSGEESAAVTFHEGEQRVTVAGTIIGSDGCKTATLANVSYDPADDLATVSVATKNRSGSEDQFCTQALVAIDYEATVTFDGGMPASVAVVHDGEERARAGHGSASASPDTATGTETGTDGDAGDR